MRGMTERRRPLTRAGISLGEAARGLLAFLVMAATLAAVAAGLLYAGERPGPPPAWPRWEDVAHALGAEEPPLEGLRYGVSMAGWLLLAYVAAVLLMQALAGALVALTRGAAWAHELERVVDLVTLPWVKRGVQGGLMAMLVVAAVVRGPELPRPSFGGDGGAVREMAPAPAVPAGGGAAVVVTAPAMEVPAGPGVEAPVAASSDGEEVASDVAAAGEEMALAPAEGGMTEGRGRSRPELPAPVVRLPGEEGQDAEEVEDGGEEAPPEGLSQQGPGVRLPGRVGR